MTYRTERQAIAAARREAQRKRHGLVIYFGDRVLVVRAPRKID